MTFIYQMQDDVAVIRLDNPPMNGLSLATRVAATQALERANDDVAVKAIVLIGGSLVFSSGADINEFGSPLAYQQPDLGAVINAFENSGKPVVAAIHGVAMGGGLELAMACHFRIAAPGCSVAFPEVKLGLVPGAGGTQRLPRVLGVEPALNLIVSGDPVKSEQLAQIPGQRLFDRMANSAGTLLEEAISFAREAAADQAAGKSLPKVRDLRCSHPQGDAYFQFARTMVKGMAKNFPAPVKCVDLVEAATVRKFDEGSALESQTFKDLMATPESAALRHLFMAERAASKIADVPSNTLKRDIKSVAVIGAGTMGGGIAMNFLNAGLPVTLLETKQEALDRGVATIRKNYEAQINKGKLKQNKFEQRMALLTTTLAYADIAQADLVIEAVFEDMGVKESVFSQLDAVMKPGAILASNTSTLNLDRIAELTRRPQDVVGLHFFSPANVMKLLEVVRGKATAKDVLATVMALGKTIHKTCVVSGVCDGFIGNRMLAPYFRQAAFLLEEGCTPVQVDRAIEKFGFPMGPFRMSDMAGNDIGWYIRKRHYVETPDVRYSKLPDQLCEMGRFGQKTGAGWYDYLPGRRDALPSPTVLKLIEQHRNTLGIATRKLDDREIVERLVFALVNEGARILEEGIAARAGDIDMVYLTGYGFPAWRGGPMQYADELGLFNVANTMKRFAKAPHGDADFWQPAALIQRMIVEGRTFNS
ncbi:3-hydroxyacyl-CoA dehydrogenase NAD-binding domain-containing protein [Janthinobacterium tructae]|uniref:3-hydroxyacyl-CoA dehydrogenase NAD-binding domain-containing protein n=1 Tax=Janthinobacterium tructae TaxID=2590869 RepID=UPI00249A2CEE|nr:3-hydroxyacyl-CoA dehydrogenase NAD-binding domain-containing protein [Janthinobacterium tructae]MDI3292314.1 3-hydroxyacyl-CoA dehydrogenase NAD-binding domain-containing protein [Janthinobacterium tructae]